MKQDDRNYLADFIKNARDSRNLTQEKLSELCGMSQKSLSEIENGRGNPTYDTLCSLLRVLNLPFNFFPVSNLSESDATLQRLIVGYMRNSQQDRRILLSNMENLSKELKERTDI